MTAIRACSTMSRRRRTTHTISIRPYGRPSESSLRRRKNTSMWVGCHMGRNVVRVCSRGFRRPPATPSQAAATTSAWRELARPSLLRQIDLLSVMSARCRACRAWTLRRRARTRRNSPRVSRARPNPHSGRESSLVSSDRSPARLLQRAPRSQPFSDLRVFFGSQTPRILDGERPVRARDQCRSRAGNDLDYGCGLFWFGREG